MDFYISIFTSWRKTFQTKQESGTNLIQGVGLVVSSPMKFLLSDVSTRGSGKMVGWNAKRDKVNTLPPLPPVELLNSLGSLHLLEFRV